MQHSYTMNNYKSATYQTILLVDGSSNTLLVSTVGLKFSENLYSVIRGITLNLKSAFMLSQRKHEV